MINRYNIPFIVFCLITLIMFFGGLLGIIFTIRHSNNIRQLENSKYVENATITHIVRRARSGGNNLVYFMIENERKSYRINLTTFRNFRTERISIGDKIEVKFNEDRTQFLITDYSSIIYRGHIMDIFLFAVVFILSIFFLFCTIEIYKKM